MPNALEVGDEESWVVKIVAEVKDVNPEMVNETTRLFAEDGVSSSLDFDSLDAFDLAVALDERFDLGYLEDVDFQTFRTVRDVVDYVRLHSPILR